MSIPALGGGGGQALQRALMEAAERALADELGLLDGEDPAGAPGDTASASAGAATTARAQVRRRAAAGRGNTNPTLLDEAIVVELGEQRRTGRLEVADGWITTAKRGPLETRETPHSAQPNRFVGPDVRSADTEPATPQVAAATTDAAERAETTDSGKTPDSSETDSVGPEASARRTAPEPESSVEPVTLERLVVVLKRTGIDFRDAYQVLREIRAGAPLPARAELRAMWAAADPAAWEERARVRSESQTRAQAPARSVTQTRPQDAADADLRQTRVDDLIRDRSWHRAAGHQPSLTAGATSAPTLQTVIQHTSLNQAYVAGLSTAEFQRLVTILGGVAPEWFWELRGHRGLRGLAERPALARLNATRIAGTRLGAWLLAIIGMALLWYVGLHTGAWW